MILHRGLRQVVRAALVSVFLIGAVAGAEARPRIYVRVGPPAPVVDVRVVSPGARYVWVPGYHRWNRRAYAWTPGHWVVPPRRHAVWVAPRWERNRHGWFFVAGRWR